MSHCVCLRGLDAQRHRRLGRIRPDLLDTHLRQSLLVRVGLLQSSVCIFADAEDPSQQLVVGGDLWCGSVRPLLPSGPITGATYIAYSSASRKGGRLTHKLHHTWAMWDVAPSNSSQQAPAPMLASFDWFMPDHNV